MTARTGNLLFVATSFLIVSFEACSEGAAHDQSGLCTINPFIPPPFLGFKDWINVGVALGVVGFGVVIGAIMLATQRD
jgi:hypothetical protein